MRYRLEKSSSYVGGEFMFRVQKRGFFGIWETIEYVWAKTPEKAEEKARTFITELYREFEV